jgi:hypothetical protein
MCISISSCKSVKNLSDKETYSYIDEKTAHQLIFMTYQITKNNDLLDINLTNKSIVKGFMKQKNTSDFKNGDLKFSILNSDKVEISKFYVSNPLHKTVEYVDEKNQFQKKDVELNTNDFFIRFQYKSNMTQVAIYKILSGNKKIHILTSEIN